MRFIMWACIYRLNGATRFVSFFFFSSRRRHTRSKRDWSSDVCSSDLIPEHPELTKREFQFAIFREADGGAFTTLQIPVLRGRVFMDQDRRGKSRRIIRSEERRVGKECRSGGGWGRGKRQVAGRWVRRR